MQNLSLSNFAYAFILVLVITSIALFLAKKMLPYIESSMSPAAYVGTTWVVGAVVIPLAASYYGFNSVYHLPRPM